MQIDCHVCDNRPMSSLTEMWPLSDQAVLVFCGEWIAHQIFFFFVPHYCFFFFLFISLDRTSFQSLFFTCLPNHGLRCPRSLFPLASACTSPFNESLTCAPFLQKILGEYISCFYFEAFSPTDWLTDNIVICWSSPHG